MTLPADGIEGSVVGSNLNVAFKPFRVGGVWPENDKMLGILGFPRESR